MERAVPDANDADLQEQSADVQTPDSVPDRPSRDPEAPEADAIEQAQPAPLADDYDR